jgi:hypothetical protein
MVEPELPLCPNKKRRNSHHQTIPLPLFYRASRFNKKARAVARA